MKRKPWKLFVDLDGTAAEWLPVDEFEDLFKEGYFLNIKPHENVVAAIEALHKENGPEIFVLSAYLTESQYALKEKNIWVEKYFPYMHRGNRLFVPQNIRKSEYVRALVGDVNNDYVLLDDYSKNLHDWVSAGGRGIKLLNGSNGTVGSWKGPSVSRFSSPKDIQKAIMGYVN